MFKVLFHFKGSHPKTRKTQLQGAKISNSNKDSFFQTLAYSNRMAFLKKKVITMEDSARIGRKKTGTSCLVLSTAVHPEATEAIQYSISSNVIAPPHLTPA